MKPNRNNRILLASLSFPFASGLAALLSAPAASATIIYWEGGTGNWTDLTAWTTNAANTTSDPAATPGSSDDLIFNRTGINTANVISFAGGDRAAKSLTFNSTGTSIFRANGSGVTTIRTLSIGTGGITINSGAGAVTIGDTPATYGAINIILSGAQTWTNNSSNAFTLAGTVSNGANLLTIDGSANTTLTGIIGNGAGGITKNGAGTLTLSGVNTYAGTTTVNTGILRATTSASALGAGALSLGGGTLQLAHTAGLNFARDTTVTATSTITADRTTSAATSLTHTLGTLSIGAQTLNITRGSNITSTGVGGITFGTTTLTAGPTVFDTAASTNLTLGAVGGAFALTKQGSGQMTLATTSTRTTVAGVTNLSAGTLRLETANALNTLATAPLNISGGTLSLGVTAGATYGGTATTVSGTATVEVDALVSTANVTQTLGTLSIGANQLNITRGANITGAAGVTFGITTLTGASIFDTAASTNLTLGAVGGAFALTKQGMGTLNLSASNGYTGLTTISAGQLVITHANALGGTTNGTTVVSGGALVVSSGITANSGESITIAGSGPDFFGALKAGTGGGTWAGTVNLDTTPRIGATAGNTLTVTGSIVNGTGNTFAVSGESGTGVVVLNPTTSNTYTGNTDIIRGILRLGKTDALPTGTTLDVDSSTANDAATFDMAGFNQSVAALQDSATTNINGKITNIGGGVGTSILTVNQSVATDFAGTIENGAVDKLVALTKSGAGTLTLSGTNTHTGGTTISNGALSVATTGALPGFSTNGSYSVANGATLAVYNAVTDANITSMLGTTNFAAGSSLGFDTTTASRTYSVVLANTAQGALGLTKLGANTLTIDQANTYTGATTISAGILALGDINALQNTSSITLGGASAATLQNSGDITSIIVTAPITAANSGVTSTIAYSRNTNGSGGGQMTLSGGITGGAGNVVFTTPNVNSGNQIQTILLGGNVGSAGGYGGTTTLAVGNVGNTLTLRSGIANALPTTTVLTFGQNSGTSSGRTTTFDLNGNNQTLAGLSNGGAVPNVRFMTVNSTAAATLTINNTADFTFGGATISTVATTGTLTSARIRGAISLVKNGAGTFTLGGTLANGAAAQGNTFTGSTQILGGILVLGETISIQNSAFDTGSILGDANNGLRSSVTTLTLGGLTGANDFSTRFTTTATGGPSNTTTRGGYDGLTALTLNPFSGATYTYSGDIGNGNGTMSLTKTGAGTQILSGTNTHTGLTSINLGTLLTTRAAALPGYNASSRVTVASGATLAVNVDSGGWTSGQIDSLLDATTLAFTPGSKLGIEVTTGSFTYANNIGTTQAAKGLVKSGAGSLVLSGTNTHTGVTTLTAGTLSVGSIGDGGFASGNFGSATSAAANIVFDGGTLQYTGANATSDRAFTINTGKTATIDTANDISFAGATGATTNGALTKLGAGKLTLTGTNTYTGATNVQVGTLVINGNISTSVSTNVAANATLGGGGTVGALSFDGASFFDILGAIGGDPLDSTTISISSAGFGIDNLVSQGAAVNWETIANGTYTLITGTLNSLNLDNFGLANAFDIDGVNGSRSAYFQNGSLQLVVIPEPNSAALIGGFGLLALLRRRRN